MSCRGGWPLLAALCGCCQQSDILVVQVSNLPQRAVALSVSAVLDGKPSQIEQEITQPLDRFGVVVPGLSGHLEVNIQALDSDRCTQGTAKVSAELPSSHVSSPLAAAMTEKIPRQCGALPGCAANTICPLSPQPQKNPIWSLWAISANDIWGAGVNGTLIHFDGANWSTALSGVATDLNSVWASGTRDVWAVGKTGKILHYNGTSWSQVPNGAVNDLHWVWGVSPTNVWAVGQNSSLGTGPGEFWHWDGTSWTKVVTGIMGALYSVWASSPSDIFACGASGLIMHFDTKWSTKVSGTLNDLYALWGSAPNQVFAAGALGTVVRYDGTTWKTLPAGGTTADLNAIFGDGKTVYIVGNTGTMLRSSAQFDSFAAVPTAISTNLFAIQLGSNGINWLGGSSGTSGVLAYFDTHP